jgi:hypothetical protein
MKLELHYGRAQEGESGKQVEELELTELVAEVQLAVVRYYQRSNLYFVVAAAVVGLNC